MSQVFSGLCFYGDHVEKLAASPQCAGLKVELSENLKTPIVSL